MPRGSIRLKGHLQGLPLLTAFIIGSICSNSLAKAEAADHGWLLRQTKLTAQCTLYVSSKGIKYGPDAQGVSYVAKSPDWILYIYNDNKKTYFAGPLAACRSMRKSVPLVPKVVPPILSPLPPGMLTVMGAPEYETGSSTTIAGMAATQYRSRRGRDWSEVYVAKDIAVPDRVNQLADFIFATPAGIHDTNRILLRREIVEKKGFHRTFLNTTLARRTDIAPSTFDPPQGYQKVKSIDQVGSQ